RFHSSPTPFAQDSVSPHGTCPASVALPVSQRTTPVQLAHGVLSRRDAASGAASVYESLRSIPWRTGRLRFYGRRSHVARTGLRCSCLTPLVALTVGFAHDFTSSRIVATSLSLPTSSDHSTQTLGAASFIRFGNVAWLRLSRLLSSTTIASDSASTCRSSWLHRLPNLATAPACETASLGSA